MGEEQVLGDNRIVGDLSEGLRAWSVSVLGHAFEGAVWYDMVDVELVGCDTEVTSQVAWSKRRGILPFWISRMAFCNFLIWPT